MLPAFAMDMASHRCTLQGLWVLGVRRSAHTGVTGDGSTDGNAILPKPAMVLLSPVVEQCLYISIPPTLPQPPGLGFESATRFVCTCDPGIQSLVVSPLARRRYS